MFPAGPQPRPSTPSVPCRTSTTTIHAQCSLPDLNHDHPRPVFPAGPQLRAPGPSVPCRTSNRSTQPQPQSQTHNHKHNYKHTTTNTTRHTHTITNTCKHNHKHTTTNTSTNTTTNTQPQTHNHKHKTTSTQPQTHNHKRNHKHTTSNASTTTTTTTNTQSRPLPVPQTQSQTHSHKHNHKNTATNTTANTSTNTQSQTHSHKHTVTNTTTTQHTTTTTTHNHNDNTAHNHKHNTQPQHTTRGPTSKIENYNTHDHGNMLLTMASRQMIEMSWWGSLEVFMSSLKGQSATRCGSSNHFVAIYFDAVSAGWFPVLGPQLFASLRWMSQPCSSMASLISPGRFGLAPSHGPFPCGNTDSGGSEIRKWETSRAREPPKQESSLLPLEEYQVNRTGPLPVWRAKLDWQTWMRGRAFLGGPQAGKPHMHPSSLRRMRVAESKVLCRGAGEFGAPLEAAGRISLRLWMDVFSCRLQWSPPSAKTRELNGVFTGRE